MLTIALAYGFALVIFVVVDLLWLGFMAPRFYRPILGDIAAPDVNLWAAILFYFVYPVGLVVFAVLPALKTGSVTTAMTYGALLGLLCYATYDLTNHATLRNWTVALTAVDMAWGTFLSGLAATLTLLIVERLVPAG